MNNSGGSTYSALSSIAPAVASTACCWGPAMVSLLGASTISTATLSRISKYRPYLLGLSTTMISYSFYRVYGPPAKAQHACCTTEAQKQAHARQLQQNRAIVWVSLAVAVAGATYGRVALPSSAFVRAAGEGTAAATGVTKLAIQIEGMHCTGCANKVTTAIQQSILQHNGTKPPNNNYNISVDHEKGTAVLEGVSVSQKIIKDAIVKAGYSVP